MLFFFVLSVFVIAGLLISIAEPYDKDNYHNEDDRDW